MTKLLALLIFALSGLEASDVDGLRFRLTPELVMKHVRGNKEFNILSGLSFSKGVIRARDNFYESVIKWEGIHGRKMDVDDLIRVYFDKDVSGDLRCRFSPRSKDPFLSIPEALKKEVLGDSTENVRILSAMSRHRTKTDSEINLLLLVHAVEDKTLTKDHIDYLKENIRFQPLLSYKIATAFWEVIARVFTGFQRPKKFVWKYDKLFGAQIQLEYSLINTPRLIGALECTEFLGSGKSIPNWWSCNSMLWDICYRDLLEEQCEEYKRTKNNLFGLPADINSSKEGALSRISRFIMRQEPPLEPTAPVLPTTSPDNVWRYLHEVRGDYGLHVFMPMFPQLRGECKKLADYGMGRDVIGDSLYNELTRPFVQPPYELPASVFADEAAMMADTEGGGAAAAAASSSGTDTHESRALSSSSRPAAAAAASCAALPEETAAARETDRLLGGTGPYVRHRAAAMAAAAASTAVTDPKT